MRRRAFLANATTALPAAAAATATAGCLGTFSEPLNVQAYDAPSDAPAIPTATSLPRDASLEHAFTVGPVDAGDPAPIAVLAYNAANDDRGVSLSLSAGGDGVLERTWTLPTDGYAAVSLHAPADYLATVGHSGDDTPIRIARNDFDCNAKTIVASIASDGAVDVTRASQRADCNGGN